jgi:hypothetical protein
LGRELVNIQFLTEKKINDNLKISYGSVNNFKKDMCIDEIIIRYYEYYDIEFLKAIVFNFNFPIDD